MSEIDFFKYSNQLKPEKGRLLISEPYLADPNFERTVILLCEHNEDGSFGFVMNKPSLVNVNELVEDLAQIEKMVYVGGPVQQDTLHYMHRFSDLEDAIQILDGVYWGGNFDMLMDKIETQQYPLDEINFYLGYSGWSAGQLETELAEETWIVSDKIDEDLLFNTDSEGMWKKALGLLGGRFTVYSNYPRDPRLN
ncbi:MAG TPA: YqgE/AlgH family protein [Cyclobacteriaceae bacterium]|nr:YqgE/AlgH family protein [Cyclobacteriaceae bacterium]